MERLINNLLKLVKYLTDRSGSLDQRGPIRHVRVKFPDQDVDDPNEEEDVQEDGADAGDLVDPVVEAVFHPATASGNRLKVTPKD